MILMVVVATELIDVEPSKQLTTAPFRSLVTGLTVILDIRGKLSLPDRVLRKWIWSRWSSLVEFHYYHHAIDVKTAKLLKVIVWDIITVTSHLWNIPVLLHVSSSWSPSWQTVATGEGEISTTPADRTKTNHELFTLLNDRYPPTSCKFWSWW